jgi:hypothetical protein
MIRKLAVVAVAVALIAAVPVAVLNGPVAPVTQPGAPVAMQPAPEPSYPAWLYEPATGPGYSGIDWSLMERCWIDRFAGPQPTRPGCLPAEFGDAYPLQLGCHWTVDYPSRYWVEQACGRVAGWPAHFGTSWWGQWAQHPAKDWVASLRAGGQP